MGLMKKLRAATASRPDPASTKNARVNAGQSRPAATSCDATSDLVRAWINTSEVIVKLEERLCAAVSAEE